ncbi:hypothetical protein ACWEQP_20780 [Streptomyces sp. NPDC004044]
MRLPVSSPTARPEFSVEVPVRDAPARTERLVWSRFRRTPAAAAFLTGLGIDTEAAADRP